MSDKSVAQFELKCQLLSALFYKDTTKDLCQSLNQMKKLISTCFRR